MRTAAAFRLCALCLLLALCVGFLPACEQGAPPPPTSTPEPTPTPAPDPTPSPFVPYDFCRPAPESEEVENSWFSDAVFIGDSRTDGLRLYSGIKDSNFLCHQGIKIYSVVGPGELTRLKLGGEAVTVLDALSQGEYTKVYLMLGINELGYYDDEGFDRAYRRLVDEVRARQPGAVPYIQSLIPVNTAMCEKHSQRSYVNNERIAVYNEIIRTIAEEKQAVYVDVGAALADETGELPAAATVDGVHFNKAHYQAWYAYLKTHTVDPDLYFNSLTIETGEESIE